MAKEIKLANSNLTVQVDDADFEYLSQFRWNLSYYGYADGYVEKNRIYMNRHIMGLTKGNKLQVDHINHNKLDNRRSNLRLCTESQNKSNRPPLKTNSTGYRGVSFQYGKYKASICLGRRITYLGSFESAADAAMAYDKAAKELHGEFAWLNFPESESA